MTDEINAYFVSLPDGVNEAVTPCFCGYTIYINKNLTHEEMEKAYLHAMFHIKNNDFEKFDVQDIESSAHQS